MAIVGSVEDALSHNPSTLFAKSILDGVMACILASNFGPGVIFSAVSVFCYQGAITLLADCCARFCSRGALFHVRHRGALIVCIGMNILGFAKIRIGNLLPALFIPILWGIVQGMF
jgi:uncharacterized membrane protein YqgA involved in biofilm formation